MQKELEIEVCNVYMFYVETMYDMYKNSKYVYIIFVIFHFVYIKQLVFPSIWKIREEK